MANALLPVSSLINVTYSLGASAALSQSLNNHLILGSSDIIDTNQRIRTYGTLAEVVADFGTSAPEYFAADEWFGQSPQPQQVSIGRWAQTATKGRIQGNLVSITNQAISFWNAITAGGFGIAINGVSSVAISGLNFSTATNLNGVASIINAALTTATVSATLTWNASSQSFLLESSVTGTGSTMNFLTSPSTGTDLSTILGMAATSSGAYVVNGIAAETAISAVALFDESFGQTWYGLFVTGASDTDHLTIAAYIEGANTKHMYFINTQEGGVLSSTDTSDIAYLLAELGYNHTVVQYSSTSLYAVNSLAAKALSVDYTGNSTVITNMYKQEPGVIGETLNTTQVGALQAKNCNVFVDYDLTPTVSIIQPGVTSSGEWIDTITGADWLAIDIQNSVFNLLLTNSTKIPQTDAGVGIIVTSINQVLQQGVNNGLIAPGIWTNSGFGSLKTGDLLKTGYYVYAPKVATQSQATRKTRLSVPIQIACTFAGAIQKVNCMINIVP